MSSIMATTHLPVTENTLIAIKVVVHNSSKKLKLPLKDLGADKLLPQVCDRSCYDAALISVVP